MTPYERLMAEEIPVRPAPPPAPGPSAPWTPEEQAQHLADLLAALDNWHWQDETRISRHLRLINTQTTARAA